MHLAVINQSTLLRDRRAIELMLEASLLAINGEFAASHEASDDTGDIYDSIAHAPKGSTPFFILDRDTSQPDAAAYHYNPHDVPTGVVLVEPTTAGGGGILDGGTSGDSLAAAFEHEHAELKIDRYCNGYHDAPDGKKQIADEPGDPLQGVPYSKTCKDGTRVLLQSLCRGEYFDADAKPRAHKFDLAGAVEYAFELPRKGYQIWRTFTRVRVGEVFAAHHAPSIEAKWCTSLSDAFKAHKTRPGSRYARRLARAAMGA